MSEKTEEFDAEKFFPNFLAFLRERGEVRFGEYSPSNEPLPLGIERAILVDDYVGRLVYNDDKHLETLFLHFHGSFPRMDEYGSHCGSIMLSYRRSYGADEGERLDEWKEISFP